MGNYKNYKNYKAVIKQAELMAMPADAAAAFLIKRGAQSEDDWHNDLVTEQTEAMMLAWDQPQVNLALAKHGRYLSILRLLFHGAKPSEAIRLSILSNTVARSQSFLQFPACLFDGDQQTAVWLLDAPDVELEALFENPNLGDSFLRDLLEAKKPWDMISNDRLASIVVALHRNERMRRPYDKVYMDGYAEYSYGAVFNAAWSLAERVQPTDQWAAALSWMYDRLEPEAFSVKNPLDIAARWHVDPADADAILKENEKIQNGWPSHYQGVRNGLARLALIKDSKLLMTLLASDDRAQRSAAYSYGAITPEQLFSAYERDGELVFDQAMHNHKIWQSRVGREALKEIAWSVVKDDKNSDLMSANIFNGIRKDLMKQHPAWFKDDEGYGSEIEASNEPATKADMQALSEILAQQNPGKTAEHLHQSLKILNSRLGWIWWISLGALLASIWRH